MRIILKKTPVARGPLHELMPRSKKAAAEEPNFR